MQIASISAPRKSGAKLQSASIYTDEAMVSRFQKPHSLPKRLENDKSQSQNPQKYKIHKNSGVLCPPKNLLKSKNSRANINKMQRVKM
ncbi:hypothetical protein BKN38_00390 [Helicobacter sp. CLO-3]|nr:hypothetical protein BKN38_00390 [Helicobacter sp. CLO-3]